MTKRVNKDSELAPLRGMARGQVGGGSGERTFHADARRRSWWAAVAVLLVALPGFWPTSAGAQKSEWRQANAAELAAALPSRAPVVSERIETEMRTASGIVDNRGRLIAGVVLITAGYSAEGKYSHYLVVQAPVRIGGVALKPGEYVFGWTRSAEGDALHVHFNVAATGELMGTTDAHWIAGSSRVESLHIWPPAEKELIQIGRFGMAYQLGAR